MVTLRGKRENLKSAALQLHRVKPCKMTVEGLGPKKVISWILCEEQRKALAACDFSNIHQREPWNTEE